MSEIQDVLKKATQEWDRELRQSTRRSFIKLSAFYKGTRHPIRYYREKELETKVTCGSCTLEYAIYGVFAYCPDCGVHNSLQILSKNFELAKKEIALAANSQDKELAEHLIGDALENAVSAFDGFGREVCEVYAGKSSDPEKAKGISFQNLIRARTQVTKLFSYDLFSPVDANEWDFACRCFQKRHLLAHNMGVIDQQYIDTTHDLTAVMGRKVRIDVAEVENLIGVMERIGNGLSGHLS